MEGGGSSRKGGRGPDAGMTQASGTARGTRYGQVSSRKGTGQLMLMVYLSVTSQGTTGSAPAPALWPPRAPGQDSEAPRPGSHMLCCAALETVIKTQGKKDFPEK